MHDDWIGGPCPRLIRRVGNHEMFKMNNWIVGTCRVKEYTFFSNVILNFDSICIFLWHIDIVSEGMVFVSL